MNMFGAQMIERRQLSVGSALVKIVARAFSNVYRVCKI